MASVTFVPSRISGGDFIDVPVPGSGDNGKAVTYSHGSGAFVYTGFEASGAVAAHVALANPHTQYLLSSSYTAADVLAKLLTVDTDGSGLNAATLQGNAPGAFATSGHNHSATYQPLDGELTAIAGLVSAADKLTYFTGSGTAALADFSTYGRALVDDADAATARNTLGLGALATAGVPGSTTQVIYNSAGALAGDAGLTYDAANDALTVAGRVVTGVIRPPSNSTAAGQWQTASGTAVMTVDTVGIGVGLGLTPDADAVLHVGGTKTSASGGYAMKFSSSLTNTGTGAMGGLSITPSLSIGPVGTSTRVAGLDFAFTISNSGVVTDCASALIRPPTWSGNAPATAATLWITDAPASGTNKYALYVQSGNVYAAGKIGIGEPNPTNWLEINKTGDVKATIKSSSTSNVSLGLLNGSDEWYWQVLSGRFRLYHSGEIITVDASNRVGIGATAPSALLHLAAGAAARAQLRFDPNSAADPTSPNDGDVWYNSRLKFRRSVTTEIFATGVQATGGVATAGATYGATEQTMLQAVYNAARTFGLLS